MTEAGDAFREYRDKRRAVRQAMISCWRCNAKHMPDEPCFRCEPDEWLAWSKAHPLKGRKP